MLPKRKVNNRPKEFSLANSPSDITVTAVKSNSLKVAGLPHKRSLCNTYYYTDHTGKSDRTRASDCTGHVQRPEHDGVGADDTGSVTEALLGHAVFKVETRFIDTQVVIER